MNFLKLTMIDTPSPRDADASKKGIGRVDLIDYNSIIWSMVHNLCNLGPDITD